jgi:hypothetical protein
MVAEMPHTIGMGRASLGAVHETADDGGLVRGGSDVESAVCFVQHELQRDVVGGDGVGKRLPDRPALHVRRSRREPGELSLGHNSTAVTEQVYRQQIRPVVQAGAGAVDGLFGTL